MRSPMPARKAGWPKMKNGTSAPSSSPTLINSLRGQSRDCHNRLSPSNTVAASELPPPRPPPTGNAACRRRSTRRGARAQCPCMRRSRRGRARSSSGATVAGATRYAVTAPSLAVGEIDESPRAIEYEERFQHVIAIGASPCHVEEQVELRRRGQRQRSGRAAAASSPAVDYESQLDHRDTRASAARGRGAAASSRA